MIKYIFIALSLLFTFGCSASNYCTSSSDGLNDEMKLNPSKYQEKFLKGIDFIARGNEPFWNIEIDFDGKMTFTSLAEIENFSIEKSIKVIEKDDYVTLYQTKNDSGEINVTVTKIDCSDNMSGEKFDYSVSVSIKQSGANELTIFKGCGSYLYDFRLYDIWVMKEMTGIELDRNKLMKGLPTFEFNLTDMRFGGHAGCNNLSGTIEIKGNKIKFGSIISTMMACPDMTVEQAVVKALDKNSFTYKIEKMKLTLENESGLIMVLQKVD